jgi:hypothetical protein
MRRSPTTSPTPDIERPRPLRFYLLRASALIAIAAVIAIVWHSTRDEQPARRHVAEDHRRAGSAPVQGLSSEEQQALDAIMNGDGFELETARGQMRFLEELARWLEEHGVEDIRAALARIVHAALPDRASALMSLWNARERYSAWMRVHRAELATLTPEERRARIWAARREIFGDRADELFEAFHRNEAIAETLHDIDQHPSGSVESRFDRYVASIREQYGSFAPQLLASRRQELMDRFIALPSVQSDLAALTPDERYAQLRALRTSAGMDEAALDRWASLDRERDGRWEEGARYMTERARLVATLHGDALEQGLAQLRQRYFGAEAQAIANEEASGFYRFERPRTYGQN